MRVRLRLGRRSRLTSLAAPTYDRRMDTPFAKVPAEELRRRRDEIDAELQRREVESRCPACGGPGVLKDACGGFHKCFGCADGATLHRLVVEGRTWVWNSCGVALLKRDPERGWGNIELAWLAGSDLYPMLVALLRQASPLVVPLGDTR